jgi:23S rRNA 5-hydroxycytidine C2501 synthase
MSPPIELLAPARDLDCGRAAIDCGADAVYIGAPRFGARAAAGNSLNDIARLAEYAHKYWARVYVTLNTLLHDAELEPARRMAWQVHEAGADGLIIQDVGLLEGELPPMAVIASTQMHNHTPERVAFLESVGIRRAILARELTLDEIRAIRRAAPRIELECFVHGALCVCYSGQCLLSYAIGGRSGNRGECAQPCRKPYTLIDADGRLLARDRHLLSLRDLNLADHLPELLSAGVTAFKIEGRLKDRAYVSNVVAYYRARLDEAMRETDYRRSSSGTSDPGFTPDVSKTFNRGYTTYFLAGRGAPMASHSTPKMVGEMVGPVVSATASTVTLDTTLALHAGDGICFFDESGELRGTVVNAVAGNAVTPEKIEGLRPGVVVHRNHDHEFLNAVNRARPRRRISVSFALETAPQGLLLRVRDEDGNTVEEVLCVPPEPARDADKALVTIRRQLEKTGDTEFAGADVSIACTPVPFLPVSTWNRLRRSALDNLRIARAQRRPRAGIGIVPTSEPHPRKELDYFGNVLNRDAEAFYRRHGVERIEPAAESGLDLTGRKVMTLRYCIREELDLCPAEAGGELPAPPLTLVDEEGHLLGARFLCGECQMEIDYLAG